MATKKKLGSDFCGSIRLYETEGIAEPGTLHRRSKVRRPNYRDRV